MHFYFLYISFLYNINMVKINLKQYLFDVTNLSLQLLLNAYSL